MVCVPGISQWSVFFGPSRASLTLLQIRYVMPTIKLIVDSDQCGFRQLPYDLCLTVELHRMEQHQLAFMHVDNGHDVIAALPERGKRERNEKRFSSRHMLFDEL